MNKLKRFVVGILTFFAILTILSIALIPLVIINIPRIIPNKKLKQKLGSISNKMGTATVGAIAISLSLLHQLEWEFEIPENLSINNWYIAMSNHQSWADIFILLIAGHKKIPLLKFFMKKELQWIPIIYLVHKTIDMPFLHRHSPEQIKANPELKKLDFENAKTAAKRFSRNPSTAFSFAEGTRFSQFKHLEQQSPYPNLLKPKVGALSIALSGMPEVKTLIDFTIVYSSNKRTAWQFLCGDLNKAKIIAKTYKIPKNLQSYTYENKSEYRKQFQLFIDEIWQKKQSMISELKL